MPTQLMREISKKKDKSRTRPLAPLGGYGYSEMKRLYSKNKIEKKSKNYLTGAFMTRISRPRRRDETSPRRDENRKEESDREI